jgi:hypothetical protein
MGADDDSSHVTEVPYDLLDPAADPPLEVDPLFVYFVKVPTVTDKNKPTDEKQGAVLQKIEHHGSVCILAGSPEDLDYFTKLRVMRVTSPKRLLLPPLGKHELACISVKLVQRDGLRLHKSSDPQKLLPSAPPMIPMLHRSTTTERTKHKAEMRMERDVLVMEFIVSQRFEDTEITTRNAWLGTDMLTLAKSKRNQRLVRQEKATVQKIMGQDRSIDHHCALYAASALSSAQRMYLTPVDFDVKMLTKEEKDKRRNKVFADIHSMVGWGSADPADKGDGQLELTPKAFFSQARKILEGLERQRELDQGAGESIQDWNLVVTGDGGTGKLAFATLFQQFLRAFGALESDTFLEKAVHEMKLGGSGKSSAAVSKVFDDAAPGMIFVKGAGAFLAEQDGVAKEDAAGKEAMTTLKKELAAKFGMVVVCMSDTKESMGRLLRSDRGLDQRFGWRVHIPTFSPMDCALVVQRDARMSPGGEILLERGLLEGLAKHIKANYEGVQNARLAVQLTKAAKLKQSRRAFLGFENEIGDGKEEEGDDVPAHRPLRRLSSEIQMQQQASAAKVLIADDFELGKPLGDQKLKDDIEAELDDLIGMDTAKEWFQLLKRKVLYVQMTGDVQVLQTCLSVVLTGNPGTGKTRFAELLCRFLVAYGLLPKQIFVSRNANELKAEHVGGTTPKVQACVAEAMGGCLFLDEAHGLAQSSGGGVGEMGDPFSKEVIKTLLTEVENNRTSLMVVLAGYKSEMDKLMRMDPGLPRRFQARLNLRNCKCVRACCCMPPIPLTAAFCIPPQTLHMRSR